MGNSHFQKTKSVKKIDSNSNANFPNELAIYQKEVYGNTNSTKNILKSVKLPKTLKLTDKSVSEEKHLIQEQYADTISLLNHFWKTRIGRLSDEDYLSLSMLFYANVFNALPDARKLFLQAKRNMKMQSQIFFGMFGWLVGVCDRSEAANLIPKIRKLGKAHAKLGIKQEYFEAMLTAFHETMSEEFQEKYTMRIRFSFTQLYGIVMNVMLGKDFEAQCINVMDKDKVLKSLEKLDHVLHNEQTCVYLELYMKQSLCHELYLFFKDYKKYHSCMNQYARTLQGDFMKKEYVDVGSEKQINISHTDKQQFYTKLQQNNGQYPPDIFDAMVIEVIDLIRKNIFSQFKREITQLLNKSSSNLSPLTKSNSVSGSTSRGNWSFLQDREHQTS